MLKGSSFQIRKVVRLARGKVTTFAGKDAMPNYSTHVDNYRRQRQGLEPVKRKKVSTSLRSDLLETLDAMAEQNDTSRSSLIEQAVAAWVVGRE